MQHGQPCRDYMNANDPEPVKKPHDDIRWIQLKPANTEICSGRILVMIIVKQKPPVNTDGFDQ